MNHIASLAAPSLITSITLQHRLSIAAMKYVIEHMEEGFSEWVILEYSQIIRDVGRENLILTSLPASTTEADIPQQLKDLGLIWTTDECVTLDGGLQKDRVCLLDPAAEQDLSPQDALKFDYFVFGGILGSHPRVDRTGILREKYGFAGRRLGALQMTTDTAIRTTKIIIEKQTEFQDIAFIDYPEIKFNKYESTEMPFRYVLDSQGEPVLPKGMLELIKHDAEQSIDDLLVE